MWEDDLALLVGPTVPVESVDAHAPDGAAVGIDLRLNKKLAEMIYEIEDGKRPMRWENLDELAAYATELGEPMSVDA